MRLGLGLGRHRPRGGPLTPPPPPPPPSPSGPTGFVLNDSGNPAVKAMLARVVSGAGRGRIVFKGDSTTAGAGGGDPASPVQLAGARARRTSAVLASLLSAKGCPTLDNAIVGDQGCAGYVSLPAYDPRVAYAGQAWQPDGGQTFAGGNYLYASGGALLFTPTTAIDTVEIVVYRLPSTFTVLIDGQPPLLTTSAGGSVAGNVVSVDAAANGFVRIRAEVPASAICTVRIESSGGILRSIAAHARALPAIDILNHASNGAASAQQGATGSGAWFGREALAFDAPDLTIVNLGLNDIAPGVAIAAYTANLQAIITHAKMSGDVLLVFPHPSGGAFATDAAAYRDAAASLAVGNGVAFLSLFDYFGGVFTPALQARMADGLVHGNADFYAEVAETYRRCIAAMGA